MSRYDEISTLVAVDTTSSKLACRLSKRCRRSWLLYAIDNPLIVHHVDASRHRHFRHLAYFTLFSILASLFLAVFLTLFDDKVEIMSMGKLLPQYTTIPRRESDLSLDNLNGGSLCSRRHF